MRAFSLAQSLMLVMGLFFSLATTAASPSYDDYKRDAVVVERLASTVAALVGSCPDGLMPDELAECQANLGTAGKAYKGKKVVVALGGGQEQFLAFHHKAGDRATFLWAPIVDLGNGQALTLAKPRKIDPHGSVVVDRQPFEGAADPAIDAEALERAITTGQVAIELVGTFGAPWKLAGTKQPVVGVTFDARALRFLHTRSGKVLLEVVHSRTP
jgi:hypothetical protein